MNENHYTALAKQLGYPESKRFNAVLQNLMTPDQAQLAVALPGTVEDVAQKTGFDASHVKEELEKLFFTGVVIPKGDFNDRQFYRFPRSMGQFFESTQATQMREIDKDTEFYTLWHDFSVNEWYPDLGKGHLASPNPSQRVVPSHKALEGLEDILPCEDYRELLKAQEKIAAVPCACRYQMGAIGEPCDHTHEEEHWQCLQFGRGAEYAIARGSGKELSTDEALELLEEITDDGLLHMWPNSATMSGINTSCNCCRDCCMMYVPMDMIDQSIGNAWAKSRYEAFIHQDTCDGCQDCVERCQFDALEMVKPEATAGKSASKKLKASVDPDKCWGCGVCVQSCEELQAIGFKVVRPLEHIPGAA